jgi:hypothetical protein
LQGHSQRYVAALRKERAARIEASRDRCDFPAGWKLNLKKWPSGRLIYLRRSNPNSEVTVE